MLDAKDAEIAVLAARNAVFSTRIAELEGLIAALRAQLGRDSSHSGKPPSSDSPFVKKPAPKRSSRTRSGRSRATNSRALRPSCLCVDIALNLRGQAAPDAHTGCRDRRRRA